MPDCSITAGHSPFIVLALPRSRTFWLSKFLSYGGLYCGHDEAIRMRSMDDIKSWLSMGFSGTAETAAAPYWRMLKHFRPDLKIVVVRRPVADVVESMMATGVVSDRAQVERDMIRLDRKLDQITKRVPGVLSVNFADLAGEETCRRVFEFCLPYSHDRKWWAALNVINIQANLPAMFRYMIANWPQISLLQSLCANESKRELWAVARVRENDGMTFQEESFSAMMEDAGRLFDGHALSIGERENAIFDKNLPLFRRLEEIGALQVVTARSNGRMFGYLMSILSPSLEDENRKVAAQTMFFASPDAPGIGMRLQRESLDGLKKRGGRWEVLQRAGTRAAGPRLGAMYKRMGAQEFGQLFQMMLEGT